MPLTQRPSRVFWRLSAYRPPLPHSGKESSAVVWILAEFGTTGRKRCAAPATFLTEQGGPPKAAPEQVGEESHGRELQPSERITQMFGVRWLSASTGIELLSRNDIFTREKTSVTLSSRYTALEVHVIARVRAFKRETLLRGIDKDGKAGVNRSPLEQTMHCIIRAPLLMRHGRMTNSKIMDWDSPHRAIQPASHNQLHGWSSK
ncbi:hypothetical protein NDU88_002722 [Pleurodeles waltl]|uniref:Uncharacterized protein n=1 Tax=Pleurodeles waltl TaxID=8319 RepID=A0AAV7VC43_PLEWA|nr:hypothetical protein NDU88_002722 [Pleurodeles waltl]